MNLDELLQVALDAANTGAAELKKRCSVGGSVAQGTIVLQGDVRVKVEAWSTEKGLKFKRVGG